MLPAPARERVRRGSSPRSRPTWAVRNSWSRTARRRSGGVSARRSRARERARPKVR